MRIITNNIRWRTLMENYKSVSLFTLRIIYQNKRSAFVCRSNYNNYLQEQQSLHEDIKVAKFLVSALNCRKDVFYEINFMDCK